MFRMLLRLIQCNMIKFCFNIIVNCTLQVKYLSNSINVFFLLLGFCMRRKFQPLHALASQKKHAINGHFLNFLATKFIFGSCHFVFVATIFRDHQLLFFGHQLFLCPTNFFLLCPPFFDSFCGRSLRCNMSTIDYI